MSRLGGKDSLSELRRVPRSPTVAGSPPAPAVLELIRHGRRKSTAGQGRVVGSLSVSQPDVPLPQLISKALHGLLGPVTLLLRLRASQVRTHLVIQAQQRIAVGAPETSLGHRQGVAIHQWVSCATGGALRRVVGASSVCPPAHGRNQKEPWVPIRCSFP